MPLLERLKLTTAQAVEELEGLVREQVCARACVCVYGCVHARTYVLASCMRVDCG